MATITSPGIGSGLDVTGLVSSLVTAEITPKSSNLNRREANVQAEISAIGALKSSLSSLQTGINSLKDFTGFAARTTVVSDESILTASANADAVSGSYAVDVIELAQAQSLASSIFAGTDTVVGTGTLTVTLGTYDSGGNTFTANPDKSAVAIEIDASNNTLAGIRDAINAADAGVSAAIINDESGARIVISSDETGLKNSIQLTVSNDGDGFDTDTGGLSQIAFDPTAALGSGENLSESVIAKDASFSINGLALTHAANKVADVLDGVTLNLSKADPGNAVTLTIAHNTAAVTGKVNSFIAEFNKFIDVVNDLTAYDPETGAAGLLVGDASIRTLEFQVRNIISERTQYIGGNISTLADIGIKTTNTGTLELDSDKLNSVLEDDFDAIGKLFAHGAFASDNQIKINKLDDNIAAGIYAVNLTAYDAGNEILEGSIGGISATSSAGTVLEGDGSLLGLNLDILGGTTGDRGTVTVFDGVASRLDAFIETYLADDGVLESRTDDLNSQIEEITDERSQLTLQAEIIEARYLRQFNALDILLAELQTTSTFLTQQLSGISNLVNRSNNN